MVGQTLRLAELYVARDVVYGALAGDSNESTDSE